MVPTIVWDCEETHSQHICFECLTLTTREELHRIFQIKKEIESDILEVIQTTNWRGLFDASSNVII